MILERIYLTEIQPILGYADKRSVKRWCHNNDVRILKDKGTKKPFVLREEFYQAIKKNNQNEDSGNKSVRERMKQKIYELSESVRNYKPIGENEKKALSIFTSIL